MSKRAFRSAVLLAAALGLLPGSAAWAADKAIARSEDAPRAITGSERGGFALGEGLAVLFSGLAAANPHLTGGLFVGAGGLALLVGADPSQSSSVPWIAAPSYLAMGAYDTASGREQTSQGQIFAVNLLVFTAMNTFLYYTDQHDAPPSGLSATPMPHGGVRLGYRWTFY